LKDLPSPYILFFSGFPFKGLFISSHRIFPVQSYTN